MDIRRILDRLLYVKVEDVVLAQRARALLGILLFMGVADVLLVLRNIVFVGRLDYVLTGLGALFLFIALYWFTRHGYRWTSYVLLISLASIIPVMFWDSITTPAVLVFMIPTMLAPLILDAWWALPMAIAETLVLAVLSIYLDVSFDIMGFVLIFTLGILAWLPNAGLEQVLRVARRTAEDLEVANRELETGRALLEEHSEELERRADYLQTTTNVAREVASELALQELLERVVALVGERFGFYHVGIFLLDEAGEWAELHAASGAVGQQMLAYGFRVAVGSGTLVGDVTENGVARILLDVADDITFEHYAELSKTQSVMTLPLRAHGRMIGALDVQSADPDAFSQEDVSVLQSLADQVASAIRNARLFEQLQASLEAQRQFYGEMSRDAWASLLQERPDLGYRSNPYGVVKIPTDIQHGDVAQALQQGISVEGVSSEGDGKNIIAVPVRSPGGQVIGVIDTYKSAESGGWTLDEKALLQEVSTRLGDALESAQFYHETRRRATREQLTREITDEMRRSINMETILQTAVASLGKALGAPRTYIRLMSDEERTGHGTGQLSAASLPDMETPVQGDERSEP
jgi:GAF domain-containing protein